MNVLGHILIGLLIAGIGTLALKFNYQLVGFTGRQDWIESKLGSGTTYFAYKVLAVVLVIGGVFYAIGLLNPFLTWALGPLAHFFPGAPGNN